MSTTSTSSIPPPSPSPSPSLSPPAPLTASEILSHPEYPYVTWDLPPARKGVAEVAKDRGGAFRLSWEVHGQRSEEGAEKIVWIMGLGAFKNAWQRQTREFGHRQPRASKYANLIFDNRGMGSSDKPSMRYSTSEMARDVIELVDELGWTDERELNLVGVSMGGMIAQEMALLIPTRISSLTLVSSAPRLINTVGFVENLRQRINLFIPKETNRQLAEIKTRLFSHEFLAEPDNEPPHHPNHSKSQTTTTTTTSSAPPPPAGAFPTNSDRYSAQELSKRADKDGFTRKGFILQAIAAGWHHKSAEELASLAEAVGRERICVLHGSIDQMITVHHAELLGKELGLREWKGKGKGKDVREVVGEAGMGGGGYWRVFDGRGHVLFWELEEVFNQIVEDMCDIGRNMKKPTGQARG